MHKKKARPYSIILLLFVIFGLPMLIASWLYNKHIIWGNKTSNHGLLISPPLPVNALENDQEIPKKWTLILFYPKNCQSFCKKNLQLLRQIQRASGKNQARIARMLLSYQTQTPLQANYPKLLLQTTKPDTVKRWLQGKNQLDPIKDRGGVFISDPRGNMMLAYPLDGDYMDIFNDLQHLLKISQIG